MLIAYWCQNASRRFWNSLLKFCYHSEVQMSPYRLRIMLYQDFLVWVCLECLDERYVAKCCTVCLP